MTVQPPEQASGASPLLRGGRRHGIEVNEALSAVVKPRRLVRVWRALGNAMKVLYGER